MQGKKIINFILAAFIIGTFVLVYMQYSSAKSIDSLITGNEKMIDEFKMENKLKDLERDIIYVESKIRGLVSTKDSFHAVGIENQFSTIEKNLTQLQQITDDDSSVIYIDELDELVKRKLKFQAEIINAYNADGKIAAEKLIATNAGKQLTDTIIKTIGKISSTRKAHLAIATASIDKGGRKAKQFSTTLIALVLLIAASLFWYIINIIRRQFQLIHDLNISEKKVKEASHIKEIFMTNMSHEIRTPMNAILGFTNLLQRKRLDEEAREYVQTIQKSGENLLMIINDILDLSKIEAGMMRIESASFNIRELINSLELMFKAKARDKGIKFSSTIDSSLPIHLAGDATRLTQILVNLIGNALKFTEKGSITIKVTKEGENENVISTGFLISDTGIGIEKEKLNSIFERFIQAEDSATRRYGGTGLGLSIAKDLIEMQNGNIKVESQPGKGTNFHFTIPYKIAEIEIKNNPSQTHVSFNENTFQDIFILVVEDNEINQSLLRHLFKSWNINYEIANNGKEAIGILQLHSGKYSLVLMDIQMPEMDGYTATLRIRHELQLKIPIIAMTAHALAGEREKCLSIGMNDYISKPLKEIELHNLINKLIDSKETIQSTTELGSHNMNSAYNFINLDYMREISRGNLEYEKTVTAQFIEAIPEDLFALKNAWKQKDINQVRQLAHNMKTTISVMGLNDILQPYLDSLEYKNLTDEDFGEAMEALQLICDNSLKEAQHFYSTF